MLEVCPGLLLGSMGDALAVFARTPSVAKRYRVTHVLSLCNERPEWMVGSVPEEESEGSGSEEEAEEKNDSREVVSTEQGEEAECKPRVRRKRREKGSVDLPKWKKYIEVADMPKSDLLHHFESCCRFIKEGRERGTVLVHCEHGVSRSVTVVLAYQMWSERRSLKTLYQELKDRRPEIRPNPGFMDQLRLWEEMGCSIREENKKYRAYRLQCKAREFEAAGYVDGVDMAPDPAASPVGATGYFRCRKCRQLLFTDSDVLQHELGEGRASFLRRKQKKGRHNIAQHTEKSVPEEQQTEKEISLQSNNSKVGETGGEGVEEAAITTTSATSQEREQEYGRENEAKKEEGEVEEVVLGGNSDCLIALPDTPGQPSPSQPLDVSTLRQELASMATQGAANTHTTCTSYFIEPVAWMGQALLGHLEGKILCPKCNSRLGSFSWKGQQCSCGQWLTPAFQVHKNRVDEVRTLSLRKKVDTQFM